MVYASLKAHLSWLSTGSIFFSRSSMCPVLQSWLAIKLKTSGSFVIWTTWYIKTNKRFVYALSAHAAIKKKNKKVYFTWWLLYMTMIELFFPWPSLLPWSVAIPKVERKLILMANSEALSLETATTGTPSLSVIKILCKPSTLTNNPDKNFFISCNKSKGFL